MKKKMPDQDTIIDAVKIVMALSHGELYTAELYKRIPHDIQQAISKAEQLGLIERVKVEREGRGQPPLVNRLTARGRKLLGLLGM